MLQQRGPLMTLSNNNTAPVASKVHLMSSSRAWAGANGQKRCRQSHIQNRARAVSTTTSLSYSTQRRGCGYYFVAAVGGDATAMVKEEEVFMRGE